MKQLLLYLLSLFTFFSAGSQTINPVFKYLNRANGLPVDRVTCLAQDSSGFMWMGSREGLFRYDGFTYKGFYSIPGSSNTLLSNSIAQVMVDRDGLLWVASHGGGLTLINSEGRILQALTPELLPGSGYPVNASLVKQDKNGVIWCATGKGLFKLEKKSGKVRITGHINLTDYGHGTNILNSFTLDRIGRLWLCTQKGIAVYNPTTDSLYTATYNPYKWAFLADSSKVTTSINLNEDKGFVCYTTFSLGVFNDFLIHIYNRKTNHFIHFQATDKNISTVPFIFQKFFTDSYSNLWLIEEAKLSLLVNERWDVMYNQNNESVGDFNVDKFDFCEDREGNLWFATDKGIAITNTRKRPFLNLSMNAIKKFPFANKSIAKVVPVDDKSILICTANNNDGIYETDSAFAVKHHYVFSDRDFNSVWDTYRYDARGKIYISTDGGMLLYNIKSHTFRKLTAPPFNQRRPVASFVPSADGGFWFAYYVDDFGKYNPVTGVYKNFSLTGIGESSGHVDIYKDSDQNIWLNNATTGLMRFDEKSEKIVEKIPVKKGDPTAVPDPHTLAFLDLGKDIFMGYKASGFSLYNKATKTFRHFGQFNGLISNNTRTACLKDKDGTVWIPTTNGLSRFDPVKEQFINYDYNNGILQNNMFGVAQLTDKRIVVNTIAGLVIFHPDSLSNAKQVLFPPFITAISIQGNALSPDSLQAANLPLNISYKENYFSIEYISLIYQNNQQVEYAYKLEGFNTDWTSAGNRRFVSYTNLKGGIYSFKVRARLPGGAWVEGKTALRVVVHSAFYTRWWFYGLCVLAVALLVYGLFRYRLQELLRVEKLRTSISSDLHDEVGSALSAISIFSEMAKQSNHDAGQEQKYLQRIGDRSRESIEKMDDIIWSINPENDNLQQILLRMKTYASEVAEAKGTAVHWTESESIARINLNMTERKNFYLLFKEGFNNAIKYSGGKNIYVDLNVAQNTISLRIKDDGVGFDVANTPPGNGLKTMQRRAALLSGHFKIKSALGSGTTLLFSFIR